jgi:DNA-binding transcriptional LysR family regulator
MLKETIMTLRHLAIFTAVADTLSMTKASSKLFIAQPSVSQAVSELERDLGVKLFERLGIRIHLTEHGRRLLPYARHISALASEISDTFTGKSVQEKIRLAGSLTVGTTLLSGLIRRLKKTNPGCDVFFRVENTGTIENMILSDEIDVAVVEGAVKSPHIVSIPVIDDELVLIADPGDELCRRKTVRIRDLSGMDFIQREEGSGTRGLFEETMRKKSIPFRTCGVMNNAEAIKLAVAAGLGVSVISRRSVEKEVRRKELRIIEIPDARFIRKFSVIHHRDKFITPLMGNFIEIASALKS